MHTELLDDKVACAYCASQEAIAARKVAAEQERAQRERAEAKAALEREAASQRREELNRKRGERERLERQRNERLSGLPMMTVADLVGLMKGNTPIQTESGVTYAGAMRVPPLTFGLVVQVLRAAGYPTYKAKPGWTGQTRQVRHLWLVGVERYTYYSHGEPAGQKAGWVALDTDGQCVYVAQSVSGIRRSTYYVPDSTNRPGWTPSPATFQRIPRYQGLIRSLPSAENYL